MNRAGRAPAHRPSRRDNDAVSQPLSRRQPPGAQGAGARREAHGPRMPWGIALFLVYGLLILAGVGLALPGVVAEAILIPITFQGVVLMALLAYTIFTLTLVIQRKE